MSDERGVLDRAPSPWGAEITPFSEVCGGQYVLLQELARGDLSIVYRAKPAGSRDVIAFKVIQPRYTSDEAQVRRFRREAELLRRIEHPNVVRLIDHGTIEDGRDFLALELLSGRTLADALAKATRMSPERTCRIARQVGRALRAMHKAGVIHRDLRPENILLIGPEDAERVKLVDLSDAGDVGAPARRVKDQTGKGASGPKGERTYRAPEQVRKRPPHPSMDVFALGVIMYEMLAGEHPFAARKDPPNGNGPKLGGHTIRTKAFDAPEVLLGLVADCIERDPDERPRTMDDVLDRIDKALLWMGVVPHEIPGDEADEDRRTQLWTAADGRTSKPAAGASAAPSAEAAAPRADAPRAEADAPPREASSSPAAEDDLEFDLEEADTVDAMPIELRADSSAAHARKPWELASKPQTPEPAAAEGPRHAQEEARRSREDEEKARAREEARRAQEEARRAQEEARRAKEEALRAQEEARRAQEEARRERERARREERSTGSSPRIDLDELRDRASASASGTLRTDVDEPRGHREPSASASSPRVDPEERWRREGSSPRIDPEELRERRRAKGGSTTTGSSPRIDLDELRERERASRDGASSGSMPRIDLEDLADGAPTGPRFVVDTVAWTKQQPSAEPAKARKRRVEVDPKRDDRTSGEREPSSARSSSSQREPPSARSSSSQRLPRDEAAASQSAAQRSRPPTAVHEPLEPLPRWLLPLLVFVLVALAYAVYLVWSQ